MWNYIGDKKVLKEVIIKLLKLVKLVPIKDVQSWSSIHIVALRLHGMHIIKSDFGLINIKPKRK